MDLHSGFYSATTADSSRVVTDKMHAFTGPTIFDLAGIYSPCLSATPGA
jgi:hypothetical protein